VCHNIKESKQNLLAKIEIKKIYHITLLINSVSGYSRDPRVNGAPPTHLKKNEKIRGTCHFGKYTDLIKKSLNLHHELLVFNVTSNNIVRAVSFIDR
jgi:hypothetical protein